MIDPITHETIASVVNLVKVAEVLAQALNCSVSRAVEIQLLVVKIMGETSTPPSDAMMQAIKSASERVQ